MCESALNSFIHVDVLQTILDAWLSSFYLNLQCGQIFVYLNLETSHGDRINLSTNQGKDPSLQKYQKSFFLKCSGGLIPPPNRSSSCTFKEISGHCGGYEVTTTVWSVFSLLFLSMKGEGSRAFSRAVSAFEGGVIRSGLVTSTRQHHVILPA